MKRLLLIATLAALAMAKPGLYKEKEDFQFSRSSTDEGSKSGYYGAQRGNMGGNYERAHNMDGLAQHQMSGLVRQVDGELGDGSNTRTGSVFTAANSRGVYGSGHFDTKNLEGRNFQEGVSFDDSQSSSQLHSHSSLSSQSGYNAHSGLNSAAYINRQSHGAHSQGGYNGYQYMGHNGVESNLQQTQNLHAANQYGYGGQEATGYYSQSASNGQSEYDQSKSNQYSTNTYGNTYGSNAQTRLISTMPVKVVLRPGTKVVVPVAAETYDASNSAAYDHNSVNSEAELLSNQHIHNSNYKPTGAKHYESSFSYKKEWEKHDAQPVTVLPVAHPTTNPFPKNSELYEDAQSLQSGQQYQSTGAGSQGSHSHSSHSYGGYNANVNSASSSQSHHQTAFNAQHHRTASSADSNYGVSSQGTYGTGAGADSTNQIEDINSKPKSYHSSYSYHKSWERQGDPYVIKPASSGLNTKSSERLTSASSNQGAWSSHTYGSRYQQAQQNVLNLDDCDEHGHRRVARSYHTDQYEQQNAYQRQQHNQDQEVLGQRSQNLEDLTQESQNKWEQSEDLTQQQSQSKWEHSEDLTQQSQSKWDQSEDLTQQSQSKWDQSEDLTQQSQSKWDQSEDLTQQSQSKWDQSEDLTQQSQNKWDQSEDLGQQTQTQWDTVDDSGRLTQTEWAILHGQQPRLDDGQQLQNTWSQWQTSDNRGMGQETETNWYNNKKPSIPNSGTEESNFFNPHGSTSPKEIPDDITRPQNLNTPINSHNKYWERPSNGDYPITPNNHFNRPWFSEFPFTSQNTEHVQTFNYHHQQSPVYNNPESSHQSPFNDFHPHTSWDEFSANHDHTTNIKPSSNAHEVSTLWNLWDKVDTIEKQTISSNKNKTDESQYSLNTKPVTEQAVGSDNIQPSIQNKPFLLENANKFWESKDLQTSTIKTTQEESSTHSTTSTTISNKPQEGKSRPSDAGRGDIGPEDSDNDKMPLSNSQGTNDGFETQPNPVVSVLPSGNQHYKTPAEIETLSQVIGSDINKDSTVVSSTTSRSITGLSESGVHYQNMGQYSGNTVTIENGKSTESDKSTLEQSVDEFGQPSEYINQNNLQQKFTIVQTDPQKPFSTNAVPSKIETNKKPIEVFETGVFTPVQNSTLSNENIPESYPQHPRQYNMDVQNNSNKFWDKLDNGNKFDYNPWLNQLPHVSSSTNYTTPQSNIYNNQELNNGQQNQDKQFSNFGQQSENLGQQSENYDQQFQNYGQQNENLGQQSEKFDQQFETIGQQSENLGQQSDNFDRQFGNFGQQSENLGQQSEKFDQQFETIGQQSENIGQQSDNFDQQFENFGQQSENPGQQSEKFDQQFETIGQQSENLGQQSDKFDQQFENFGQQSENPGQQSEKFDQQFETIGQQSENLGQQSDKFDQQFENFGQQSENPGQQSEKVDQQFETIGQQSENLGQQSEKFDQQFENFGQQSENLGQQSEKFDQQFENFGQQSENLGQQSEKFDQQFESVQQPVEQLGTFWQKFDKNNKQDAGQEQINLSTPNKKPDESVEPVEPSNERNMYKEQQSENWKQDEALGQQVQTGWEHHQNQDDKTNIESLQVIPVEKPIEKLEIPEDRAIKTETVPTKDFIPTTVSTPPETDKDKPGFWKSVGNKFVNAKDKVFSWFGRS